MRSIPVVMTCCGLLVAACTYIPTTGLSVRGPATMSVHAKAELQVGAASDGGVPRPTRFRRLLVPPECDVEIDNEEPTLNPGIRVSARDPVGTFLVSGLGGAISPAELVDRQTGAVTPILDRPSALRAIYVAAGALFGTAVTDEEVEVAWGFVNDAWVEWETSASVRDESFGLEEPLAWTSSQTAAVLRVEEGRVDSEALDVGWQELSSAARGIPGSRLFLLRRTAAIEVVRLTHEGLETVALAPWTVTNGSRGSGPVLVTNDAVVFPAQAVGGAPARFNISR